MEAEFFWVRSQVYFLDVSLFVHQQSSWPSVAAMHELARDNMVSVAISPASHHSLQLHLIDFILPVTQLSEDLLCVLSEIRWRSIDLPRSALFEQSRSRCSPSSSRH